ncbi:MAG: fibronectin type III domain-containing protein [Clostridia bacterium]|nr:fibronectin type III domain-containing protein [Clostridia bacterium]
MKKIKNIAATALCVLLLCAIWSLNAFAYSVDSSLMTEKRGNETYEYFISQGEAVIFNASVKGDITLPETLGGYKVKEIFERAFNFNTELTGVTVPGNIEVIGKSAFSNCHRLEKVVLHEGVRVIADYAFDTFYEEDTGNAYCSSIKELSLPDSVEYIGSGAFSDSEISGQLKLPESLKEIGSYAFNYTNITEVYIPEGVTVIGTGAFNGCPYLKKITVADNNKNYASDEDGVLFNKDKTVIVQYPNALAKTVYEIPDTVSTIGVSCFGDCRALGEIVIPHSVKKIEDHGLYLRNNIKVIIPLSVKEIGSLYGDSMYIYYEGTREEWEKLDEKCGPQFEKTIHFDCKSTSHNIEITETKATCLKSATKTIRCSCSIENTVYTQSRLEGHGEPSRVIVSKATPETDGLINKVCAVCGVVDTVTLEKVEAAEIQIEPYNGKNKKPRVRVKDASGDYISSTYYDVIYEGTPKEIGIYPVTVTLKGEYYQGSLTADFIISPAMPSKLKLSFEGNNVKLTWSKVSGATGYRVYLYDNDNKKPKVIANVKNKNTYTATQDYYGNAFGYGSFKFAVKPYTVLSDGRTVIGEYYIHNYAYRRVPEYVQKIGNVSYEYYVIDGAATISDFSGSGDIIIPEKLGGYAVKHIGSDAFLNSDITSAIIPEGVETIDQNAFLNSKIKEITIPSTLKEIGKNALSNCYKLEKITVNKDNTEFSSDENGVLFNKDKTILICYPANNKTEFYKVPDTVVTIAEDAFRCADLLQLELPESLKTIEESAFSDMNNLKELKLPSGLEKIGGSAFFSCGSLESMVIPQGVKEIPAGLFTHCGKLKTVIIPDSVVSIGKIVFGYITVEFVGYCGSKQQWQSIENSSSHGTTNLHYNWHSFEEHAFKKVYEKPADCYYDGQIGYACACGAEKTETIKRQGHDNICTALKKATAEVRGIGINECRKCGEIGRAYIGSVKVELYPSGKMIYNGKVQKPEYSVMSGYNISLKENVDYTVTYSEPQSKKIGKYKIRFISTENSLYSFDITAEYSIVPAGTQKITAKSGKNSIKLTWQKVENATGYRVYRYDTSKSQWVKLTSTKSLSYTANKLSEGTKYKFYVRAYTKLSDGTVIWSSSKVKREFSTTPPTPKNFAVSSKEKNTVSLSWDYIDCADGYTVLYATSKNGKYKKLTGTDNNNMTSFNVKGLKSGKTYYFKVRAYTEAYPENIRSSYTAVKSIKIK